MCKSVEGSRGEEIKEAGTSDKYDDGAPQYADKKERLLEHKSLVVWCSRAIKCNFLYIVSYVCNRILFCHIAIY